MNVPRNDPMSTASWTSSLTSHGTVSVEQAEQLLRRISRRHGRQCQHSTPAHDGQPMQSSRLASFRLDFLLSRKTQGFFSVFLLARAPRVDHQRLLRCTVPLRIAVSNRASRRTAAPAVRRPAHPAAHAHNTCSVAAAHATVSPRSLHGLSACRALWLAGDSC